MAPSERELIRKRRIDLVVKRRDIQRQLDHVTLDLKHVQLDCDHPGKYRYYAMGDPGWKCDDCGWAT